MSHLVGSEGLLSFRSSPLEPQRFAAACGLQGSYVPGKRWTRPVGVLQPLAAQSYSCECNGQDLICLLLEVCTLPVDIGVMVFPGVRLSLLSTSVSFLSSSIFLVSAGQIYY